MPESNNESNVTESIQKELMQKYYDYLKKDIDINRLDNKSTLVSLEEGDVLKLKKAQILIQEGKAIDEAYKNSIDIILDNETIKNTFSKIVSFNYKDIEEGIKNDIENLGAFQDVGDLIRKTLSTEGFDSDLEVDSDLEEDYTDKNINLMPLGEIHGKTGGYPVLNTELQKELKAAVEKRQKRIDAATKIQRFIKHKSIHSSDSLVKDIGAIHQLSQGRRDDLDKNIKEFKDQAIDTKNKLLEDNMNLKESIDTVKNNIEVIKNIKHPNVPKVKEIILSNTKNNTKNIYDKKNENFFKNRITEKSKKYAASLKEEAKKQEGGGQAL